MKNVKISDIVNSTCRSCKHIAWLIGAGQGIRCPQFKRADGSPQTIGKAWNECQGSKFSKKEE